MIPGNANPLLLASAAADAAAAGPIKSVRFNSADSAHLTRTPSSAGNRRTWTWSAWVKRSKLGERVALFTAATDNVEILFEPDDVLRIYFYPGSYAGHTKTVASFRDTSAWYHIVFAIDTTQTGNDNIAKIYVNGVQQEVTHPNNWTQNSYTNVNNTVAHYIGSRYGPARLINAYMADIYLIDGQQLDCTSFGAFDDNGVWQAAAYSGTFGTNGFHLLDFANESTIGHDSSGNENDFTANNLSATGTAAPAVTSNGNPTSSTDSPFSSGYSVDFDGDDSLTITGPGAIAGDFTVECFVKSSSYAGTQRIFSADQASQSGERLNLRCYNGATEFYVAPGVSASGTTFPTNQWNHIAITRSGSDVSYYLNGSRWATDTHSGAISVTTFVVAHGFASEYFTGKVSNARFVDGQALYTGASYTQPTATLTTTSQGATAANVRLICCHQSSVTAAEGSVADPPSADILFDVPTNGTQSDTGAGGEVSGNYATFNPLDTPWTLSNGNLDATAPGSPNRSYCPATIFVNSGKYYAEFTLTNNSTSTSPQVGVVKQGDAQGYIGNTGTSGVGYEPATDRVINAGTSTVPFYNTAFTSAGVVVGLGLDMDAGTLVGYVNGTSIGTLATGLSGFYAFACGDINGSGVPNVSVNFGQRAFAYGNAGTNRPAATYKALCTTNLSTPTIADGSAHFKTGLYTGTGSSSALAVSGPSNPDFVWIKRRSGATSHALYDAIRGFDERLYSNSNTSAYTYGSDILVPTSTGFNLTTTDGDHNTNSGTYVAWQWDAGANSNKTYTVKVVSDSGNKYRFDDHGTSAVTLDLAEGSTYIFDQSDSSNSGHPLRFSTTSDGTHGSGSEYTTGVTATGTPGSAGAKTTIVVAASAPTLYYYCTNHSGMGGQINTNSTAGSTRLSGSQNSSAYNSSQTWSNGWDSNLNSSYPGTRSFDGDISTGGVVALGSTATWTAPGSGIAISSSLRIYGRIETEDGGLTINFSDSSTSTIPVNATKQWHTISGAAGKTLTSIAVTKAANGDEGIFHAVQIDGKTLLDSGATPVDNFPSINSVVKVNSEAGFSIVTATQGSGTSTWSHGLNVKPDFVVMKARNQNYDWYVSHSALENQSTKFLRLNLTDSVATNANWFDSTEVTSSVVTSKAGGMWSQSDTFVAYCFAAVAGYSAFGSYTGNGLSGDGPFVHTGFRPSLIILKPSSGTGNWTLFDTTRDTFNVADSRLHANLSDAEATSNTIDILSNGFKIYRAGLTENSNNVTYIYAAFSENAFSLNGGLAR